jgi:hypothetical protein
VSTSERQLSRIRYVADTFVGAVEREPMPAVDAEMRRSRPRGHEAIDHYEVGHRIATTRHEHQVHLALTDSVDEVCPIDLRQHVDCRSIGLPRVQCDITGDRHWQGWLQTEAITPLSVRFAQLRRHATRAAVVSTPNQRTIGDRWTTNELPSALTGAPNNTTAPTSRRAANSSSAIAAPNEWAPIVTSTLSSGIEPSSSSRAAT